MTISLEKGNRQDLTKDGLHNFYVGLGWDTNKSGGADYDLDVSAFILKNDANGDDKLLSEPHFVYFNNKKSPNGSIIHTGDNLTGEGDGDDEALLIDLSKIEAEADEISIVVTIYKAAANGQNFGQVKNAYIRICELAADGKSPGTEVMRFDLEEDYSAYMAVQFGSIYRKNGEWKFNAAGFGYKAELNAIVDQYRASATA